VIWAHTRLVWFLPHKITPEYLEYLPEYLECKYDALKNADYIDHSDNIDNGDNIDHKCRIKINIITFWNKLGTESY
jgi:hypothetical protein